MSILYLAYMKYLLFALLLSLAHLPAKAQESVPVTLAFPYRYAVLVTNDRYFLSGGSLALDYGQRVKGAVAEPDMVEMAENIGSSTSVVDALNYLARHGWELMSVTNVPSDASGSTSKYISSETRYLHRRRVTTP